MFSGMLKRLSGSGRGSSPRCRSPEDGDGAERTPPRIPMYRLAILRVCQLQIKICSKMLELAPRAARGHGVAPVSPPGPASLKRLAGRRVLRTGATSKSLAKDGALPVDLVFFLQRGARDD